MRWFNNNCGQRMKYYFLSSSFWANDIDTIVVSMSLLQSRSNALNALLHAIIWKVQHNGNLYMVTIYRLNNAFIPLYQSNKALFGTKYHCIWYLALHQCSQTILMKYRGALNSFQEWIKRIVHCLLSMLVIVSNTQLQSI